MASGISRGRVRTTAATVESRNMAAKLQITWIIFFYEGTVTNPAIRLVLSAVRIFPSLTTVTVTAGNSAGEIAMFS